MELSINILDYASPELAFVIGNQKQIVAISLRRTVFYYRRKLVEYLKNNGKPKEELNEEGKARVLKRARAGVADRHIHRYPTKWKGRFGNFTNTIRFFKSGKIKKTQIGNSYTFGFVDERAKAEARYKGRVMDRHSKSAAKFGKAIVDGMFYDKTMNRYSNNITPSMRKYFAAIGLNTKKQKLNMEPDPSINNFFKANTANMVNTFVKNFEIEFARKVARERARRGPNKYNTRKQQATNKIIKNFVSGGNSFGLTGTGGRALTASQARTIGL